MSGRLGKILERTDTPGFWMVVFVIAVLFVFAYAFASNRRTVADHEKLIAEQQRQLTYLCETVTILDALTTQQLRITRKTLADPTLPLWAQIYMAKRERLLGTTHEELSNTRGCRLIE